MNDSIFVDTNILIYARDAGQTAKQPVAQSWLRTLWRLRRGRLSFQVLQEYYANVTTKLKPGLPPAQARQDVRNLALWNPINIDADLLETAWGLADRFGFSWWDAQIAAAARRVNCAVLLSEDMHHGLDMDGTLIINPFAADAPPPPMD